MPPCVPRTHDVEPARPVSLGAHVARAFAAVIRTSRAFVGARAFAFSVIVLGVSLVSSCAADWRADVARWTYPQPLPASLPLVDDRGSAFTLADLRGAPVVLAFFFTRC